MNTTVRTKAVAAVVTTAVTLSTWGSAQPAAAAAPVPPAQIAGDWIAGQLTDGLAIGGYGPDLGLSIDAGLALEAIGRTAGAEQVGDSIAPGLVTTARSEYGYVKATEYDWNAPYDELGVGKYANATAKAAAFTQRLGRDAKTQYAEIDLLAQLEELTSDTTGRIADSSAFGDYANTIGQSFAVEALTRAGSTEAPAATAALLAQQCPAGFFRLSLGATACADTADPPGPDVTALAVISLVRSRSSSPAVASAVTKATDWLESRQAPDGSVGGDATSPTNSNSTGLTGWALGEAGRTAGATRAAAWTRSLQAADAGACASKAPTGAIAYTAADLAGARAEGLSTKRDTWRRATFQATPALRWAPAASVPLAITTPSRATASSTVNAVVSGLAPGEHGCVALGAIAKPVVGTGSDLSVTFDLPAGPGTHAFSVTTLAAIRTSTTTVPAPAEVPAPAPVTAGLGDLVVSKVERVRNGALRLGVTCDQAQPCQGTLGVRTRRKVELHTGSARRLVVARVPYHVEPGTSEKLVLDVRRPVLRALRTGRLPVVAKQLAPGADTVRTRFWLRRG